ncbi:PRC-barrel domain containing protein [Baekduia soli]|uniref:PRC-barrel domain containing protein n=1 Tax=Baekduia soli TaxID=496014 RepID=A0A5B8U5V9_9ACTN|nr:PRC-barrel domain-containing protein [Baekduia soli]QEC48506.1 PRC-barrel domain containing protein [Baekduia soli]
MRATGIVPALHDAPLRDRDGTRVGYVEDLLADARTNRPAWLVVCLDDGRRTVVPARGCRPTPAGTRAPHPAGHLTGCPATLAGAALEREAMADACRHYGVLLPSAGPFVAVRAAAAGASGPQSAAA